jgi:hypothetical protein
MAVVGECGGGRMMNAGRASRLVVALVATMILQVVGSASAQMNNVAPGPRSAATKRATGDNRLVALAAEVVRSMTRYRESLAQALVVYEAQFVEAEEALEERRVLHARSLLEAPYVEEAERALAAARRDVDDTRTAIEEADRLIFEASVQEHLARLAPLAPGAYQDTDALIRYNGRGRWSLADVPRVERAFADAFGRALPISALGQTAVHTRIGFDHRDAADVAVHPDSVEGRWLMGYLRQAEIPFIGVRLAVPGTSTGAHVHIGRASARLATR